jgi:hypothetical protein
MENTTLTKEQRELRIGKFTGSEIYKLMGVKGFGKTGETYITEKAAEFLTGEPIRPEFTAASTQWGIDHELEAQLYFEHASGLKIAKCGTIENDFMCGTPDGILEDGDCGFEIKCPYNSGNHLKNFLMATPEDLLDLRPEYYWQVRAYQWLTGLHNWKFCSYDPRFKEEKRMLILNVPWHQEHIDLLKNRVTEAKLMFDNIISKLKN